MKYILTFLLGAVIAFAATFYWMRPPEVQPGGAARIDTVSVIM